VFCILFLDTRHRILAIRDLFRGTIDIASIHPREVIHEALVVIDIRLLDHLIVCGNDCTSMAERGLV
jgi:DNA repair protein RadC